MVERVFLTETRRAVLKNDFEGADATKRSQKSRIRTRARLALEELIEVAASDEIDNEDIFDPAEVQQLLCALLGDNEDIEPFWEAFEESDAARTQYHEEYEYERSLVQKISYIETLYSNRLLSMREPQHLNAGGLTEEETEE